MESNSGPTWYCTSCTHKITLYQASIQCNDTTMHWIHLKCSHIKLKTYSLSFLSHIHQTPKPKTLLHTSNSTPITPFSPKHQQTKNYSKTTPLNAPHNLPKQHPYTTAQHQLNHQENNRTHPLNLKTKIHIITLHESNLNNQL